MHTPYADKLPEWNEFPISSDWQTKEERDMSISAYNLTVACSVTSFSGFEAEEFNLNLLKRNAGGTSYFGVSMNEGRVSGSINAEVEERLQQIWTNAGRRLPVVGTFDLSHFLAEAKKSSWFDLAGPRQDLIARYGESYVLSMLLDFADLCMLLTSNADSKNEAPLRLVLSTTLPVVRIIPLSLDIDNLGISSACPHTFVASCNFVLEQTSGTQVLERLSHLCHPPLRREERHPVFQ